MFFADLVDPQTATEYIAGMILLGVAPCTAMVFVWSHLTKGDANYTLVQVSVNDLIMIFAFAPLAGFLLGITDIVVPWETLILSVTLYVVIPLVAGAMTRKVLHSPESPERLEFLVGGAQALFDRWAFRHHCSAVWFASTNHPCSAIGYCAHRNPALDSDLWHLCYRVSGGALVAG